jgi:hypothetical protein
MHHEVICIFMSLTFYLYLLYNPTPNNFGYQICFHCLVELINVYTHINKQNLNAFEIPILF